MAGNALAPPEEGWSDDTVGPLALGLDEAGRGSVIGPLVVGGFLAPVASLPRLRALGARDSKELTAEEREEAFVRLASVGRRLALHLHPAEVDRWVRHRGLNELEARSFGTLVKRTRPQFVYADACDPVASRFASRIALHAGTSSVIYAAHKADETEPIVGAASIVAKVLRDRAITRLAKRLQRDVGCGYPHDPTTVALVRHVVAAGESPTWLRHSWATTKRLNPLRPGPALEAFDR